MHNLIQIHLDDKAYTNKPKEKTIGSISNRITSKVSTVTIEELAEELSKGKTAVCGIMNGNRQIRNFESQTVVMLDFDNEKDKKRCTGSDYLTLTEVKSHPYIVDNASFIYSTFSSTEAHEKFRVVFVLDKTLTNVTHVYNVYNRLFKEFPQADIACKDSSRIFFGGTDYQEVSFENTLKVLASDLTDTKVMPAQTVAKAPKSRVTSEIAIKNTSSSYNAVAEAIANADLGELERLIGNKFAKQVPSINLAASYLKNINMCELFNLPLEQDFHDILHEEDTPSARIYLNETGYYYNCFSSSAEFGGDLISVIGELIGKSRNEAFRFSLNLFKVTVKRTEEEEKVISMLELLISDMSRADFKQILPNVYKVLNREKANVIAILSLIKDNTFYDFEEDKIRTAIVMSSKTIAKAIGSNEKTVKRTMSKMKTIGMIIATPNKDIPKAFLRLLESQRISELRKYRTSMHEVRYTEVYYDGLETNAGDFKAKGVVQNGLNKQGLVVSMGTDNTQKVYVQDKVTTDLPLKTRNFLKRMNANATLLLNNHGYIREADLIPTMMNNRIKKSYATMMVQKFRGHMIDTLQVVRVKVTKATKAQYQQLENVNYGSFVYIKEEK